MSAQNYANKEQLIDILQSQQIPVLGAGGGFAPLGTESYFDGTLAPQGWLLCDGSTHNIADYPELAAYIASHHGSTNYYGGDGVTTFATPKREGMPNNEDSVYGDNEHIVGVWHETVDGVLKEKPVYKRTIHTGGFNVTKDTDATILDISSYNIDVFITASIRGYESTNIRWTPFGDKGAFSITADGNNIRWRSNTSWAFVDSWLIIQYTKTSDDWQLPQYGHSADGNGVFCIKATLSDTELNNMHVYSPNEHQVGLWQEEVDGVLKQKPVYEKTFISTGDISFDSSDKTFVKLDGVIYDASNHCIHIAYQNNNVWTDNSTIHVGGANGTWKITVQYTKTTDEWRTV